MCAPDASLYTLLPAVLSALLGPIHGASLQAVADLVGALLAAQSLHPADLARALPGSAEWALASGAASGAAHPGTRVPLGPDSHSGANPGGAAVGRRRRDRADPRQHPLPLLGDLYPRRALARARPPRRLADPALSLAEAAVHPHRRGAPRPHPGPLAARAAGAPRRGSGLPQLEAVRLPGAVAGAGPPGLHDSPAGQRLGAPEQRTGGQGGRPGACPGSGKLDGAVGRVPTTRASRAGGPAGDRQRLAPLPRPSDGAGRSGAPRGPRKGTSDPSGEQSADRGQRTATASGPY